MNNIIGNINSEQKDSGNILMKSKNGIYCNSFYFQDFYDDNLIKKFIKSTEAIIRQSVEYHDYLALIKSNYNTLNYDNILSNISSSDASIEIHHYPFTLYDLVDIVMTHKIVKKENFTSFSLAKEIMELHFKHKVGFVPLTITNHELAHDDALFISTDQIFGNWKSFYNEYEDGISEELKIKIAQIEKLSDAKMASNFRGIL